MKIYGLKSLVALIIGLTILTAIMWSVEILLVSLATIAIWTQAGISIFKIDDRNITLQSLSLFKKTVTFELGNIVKLVYDVGGYHGLSKITIITSTGTYKRLFFLSWWETKKLYKHLLKLEINVESKGANAYDWIP